AHALSLKADNWRLWQLRADFHAKLGHWLFADNDLTTCLRLKPTETAIKQERGKVRLRLKQYVQALADLEVTLHLNPKNHEAALLRAETLIDLGKLDKAQAGLKKVIPTDPHSARAHALLATAQRLKKDYKAALTELDAALRLDPDYAFAYWQRGLLYMQTG